MCAFVHVCEVGAGRGRETQGGRRKKQLRGRSEGREELCSLHARVTVLWKRTKTKTPEMTL